MNSKQAKQAISTGWPAAIFLAGAIASIAGAAILWPRDVFTNESATILAQQLRQERSEALAVIARDRELLERWKADQTELLEGVRSDLKAVEIMQAETNTLLRLMIDESGTVSRRPSP